MNMQRGQMMASIGVKMALGTMTVAACWPALAVAQTTSGSDLMNLDRISLRGEIQSRYDAALGQFQDQAVVAADSAKFMWASQAKDQCGIALGFLKSGTKDPVSVGKCAEAYDRMLGMVAAPPPVSGPPQLPCNTGPYIVFFEWDRFDITPEAAQVLDNAVEANRNCSSLPMAIAGYTDRSGSDSYNQGLSGRRAAAVQSYVVSKGISTSAVTTEAFGEANPRVPTADGVRELQNRRAEINFK